MYNSQEIANRIKSLTKERGKSLGEMLSACGLGVNTVSKMSKGTDILTSNIAKIADYLGCSVDYLLGRTDSPTGDTAAPLASGALADIDYDLMERRIIERYRVADDISKAMVLRALGLEEEEKEESGTKVTA